MLYKQKCDILQMDQRITDLQSRLARKKQLNQQLAQEQSNYSSVSRMRSFLQSKSTHHQQNLQSQPEQSKQSNNLYDSLNSSLNRTSMGYRSMMTAATTTNDCPTIKQPSSMSNNQRISRTTIPTSNIATVGPMSRFDDKVSMM